MSNILFNHTISRSIAIYDYLYEQYAPKSPQHATSCCHICVLSMVIRECIAIYGIYMVYVYIYVYIFTYEMAATPRSPLHARARNTQMHTSSRKTWLGAHTKDAHVITITKYAISI